jgi:hypothetical protein
MNTHVRFSSSLPVRWCVTTGIASMLMLASSASYASAYATRGPVLGAPAETGYVGGTVSESGLAESNPSGATEDFAPGYHVTTRASADNTTGALKGSAGYKLDNNTSSTATTLPGAFFDDILYGQGVVTGGTFGSTVKLTLTLDVHGAFTDLTGKSDVGMQAYLYADNYLSQLEFSRLPGTTTIATYAVGRSGTLPNSPLYADATPLVFSTASGDLRGQARITFNAVVGQLFNIEAAFAGGAGPVISGGQYLASSANVDAWGTAQLHLLLPSGYSITGTTGALTNAITTSVPEPSSAWLFAMGGLILMVRGMRQKTGAC